MRNHILINVICDEMDRTALSTIFMPDRERKADTNLARMLEDIVIKAIKEDDRLRAYAAEIRMRRATEYVEDTEETKDFLAELAKIDPAIKDLFLAIVLDLFNREVVGWSLKPRMPADIVTDALTMAWFRKKPAAGLMHHSDRGSQYASQVFQSKLKEYGMICSMSRKGNCWDNAPTESWFNSFKNERVHGLRYETREAMTAMSFDYIEALYNRKRQHSTLGYKSPMQFLNDWLVTQQKEKLVA